jgi:hypothetical protein
MIIAEFNNEGKVVVVSFDELQKRFPHTSFCTPITPSTLPEGYFLVEANEKPNTIRQLKEKVIIGNFGLPFVEWTFANTEDEDKDLMSEHMYSEIERLTKETDWAVKDEVPDFIKNKYKKYREALWSLPNIEGFPFNIDFPEIK